MHPRCRNTRFSWVNRNLPPINTLQYLDSGILYVSYRMLLHQNQGDPSLVTPPEVDYPIRTMPIGHAARSLLPTESLNDAPPVHRRD
jgi:hypothetical protein